MFDIKITPQIRALAKKQHVKLESNESITLSVLVELVEKNSKLSKEPQDLQNALFSKENPLSFVYPKPYVPGSSYSKEFKEQLARLKMQEEEREYRTMVSKTEEKFSLKNGYQNISNYTPDPANKDELTPNQINKQIKEQVTTIFNILISVLSVIWAVWYWSGKYVGVGYKIILCLAFGILVLVAEIVVYNSYLRKIDEAKTIERSKKITKQVIKKYSARESVVPVNDRK
ncbi:hypothetical protein ACO0QE_002100 [Hanseniaspora vineae]